MLAFLIPLGVSFGHSLKGHEHFDTCKVSSDTHVHENDLDCDLGDLHLVKVGMYAFAKAEITTPPPSSKQIFSHTTCVYILDVLNRADRGPPFC